MRAFCSDGSAAALGSPYFRPGEGVGGVLSECSEGAAGGRDTLPHGTNLAAEGEALRAAVHSLAAPAKVTERSTARRADPSTAPRLQALLERARARQRAMSVGVVREGGGVAADGGAAAETGASWE